MQSTAAMSISACTGVLLLCYALTLVVFKTSNANMNLRRLSTRSGSNQLQVVGAIPDPNSKKVDLVYRLPNGTRVDSDSDGRIWAKEIREEYREAKLKQWWRRHLGNLFVSLIIGATFGVIYKQKVVDKIRLLDQRPINDLQDFPHGICDCIYPEPNWHLCLHSCCCCWCRAAHTWHVAQLCEYYPALFLLTFAYISRFVMCIDPCIYTYYRVKLKEKLGIKPDYLMDCLYSLFCPQCAVAQEAMAVDEELGVEIKCCCDLRSRSAIIGNNLPHGRGAQMALRDPNNTPCRREDDNDLPE